MATLTNIFNNINTVIDEKVAKGIIVNSSDVLDYKYTLTVTGTNRNPSTACVNLASTNNVHLNYCSPNKFKSMIQTYIMDCIGISDVNKSLNKTIEVRIYRLIIKYIYDNSTVSLVPSIFDNTICWYQKIILLNTNIKMNDFIISNSDSDIIESNVLTTDNDTGFLQLLQKLSLFKPVSNLNINLTK